MKRFVATIAGFLFCFSMAYASNEWHALLLADTHVLPQKQSLTQYHHSDTGSADLWVSAQREVTTLITKTQPQFVMLLGDLPAHDIALSDMAAVDKRVFQTVTGLSVGRPWFYVTGNNDSLTGDYHSFSHRDNTGTVTNVLTTVGAAVPGAGFASQCEQAQGACVIDAGYYDEVPYYFGFYSAYPKREHHLRLIVLNSMLWLSSRYVSDDGVSQQQAGDRQMQWLGQQLANAAERGEQVLLAMHVPSGINSYAGSPYWRATWQSQWDTLLKQYQATIALVINGHTHMNALRVIRTDAGAVANLTVPGITPLHGNNPGVVDSVWQTDDSHQEHWFDANVYAYDSKAARWSLQESIRQAYVPTCQAVTLTRCLADMAPDAFDRVLDQHYLLRSGEAPHEGWVAVNNAAHQEQPL